MRQRGFSLVEVMVSMVIALLTFLVMFQTLESWNRSKRTAAGGTGAMTSGAIGMFRMENDIRLAGFGLALSTDLGCPVTAYDASRPNGAASGAVSATVSGEFSFLMTPVRIIDGGTGPDQIAVLYGALEGASTTRGFAAISAGGQPFIRSPAENEKEMDVGALGGFRQGDLAIVAQDPAGTACNLVEITNTATGDRRSFQHVDSGSYTDAYTGTSVTPRFNKDFASSATGRVYGMGPRPQRRIWQIREGRTLSSSNDLRWTDSDADGVNDFVDVADNVIDLQAQYVIGVTPANTAGVNTCINVPANATGINPYFTTTLPDAACQPFVWGVRAAILVRSDEMDKLAVTVTEPTWAGGTFRMVNLDGSAGNTTPANPKDDWRHYRYKVIESVIPLKNNIWGSRT